MMLSKKSLLLFKKAARDVPAYEKFLKSHGINPRDIKRVADLKMVPSISKESYLKAYSLDQLLWSNELKQGLLYCSTSGSTGEPFYFPREDQLSAQYSEIIESFVGNSSYGINPTLVIIGFGMGVWIGGVITLRAFEIAAKQAKLPVSLLPAGYNKVEIIKALKKLAPHYGQVVIVGYPPFIKDVLEAANSEGVSIQKMKVRLLFAAESFTETFRDYISRQAGIKNVYLDTMNIYGSADIGAMASETPISILARRLLLKKPQVFEEIFNSGGKTPTLAQFDPRHIEFEEQDGQLLLTGNSALPLIRYEIGDHGGVYSYDQLNSLLKKHNIDLETEAQKLGIKETIQRNHPFVYVYERADFTATLHGINIYPEFIKEALIQSPATKLVTEKFIMQTRSNRRHNQYLEINIELRDSISIKPDQKKTLHKLVIEALKQKSSEFQEISKQRNPNKIVKLVFWPFGSDKYFAPGIKQRWVAR